MEASVRRRMISITRLRLRAVWILPQFVWLNERIARQVRRSPGFRGGKLLADRNLTFWTVTKWDSEAAIAQNTSWAEIPHGPNCIPGSRDTGARLVFVFRHRHTQRCSFP